MFSSDGSLWSLAIVLLGSLAVVFPATERLMRGTTGEPLSKNRFYAFVAAPLALTLLAQWAQYHRTVTLERRAYETREQAKRSEHSAIAFSLWAYSELNKRKGDIAEL